VLIKFQNPDLGLSPAQIADMRLAYGADSPLWRQYLHTLLAMLHGDFGYSLQAGLAVSSLIASNLPDTLSLACRPSCWPWRWRSPSPSPRVCRGCAG
jgi:peptide/nickel transport system permease protein